jgi:hypothetical protein
MTLSFNDLSHEVKGKIIEEYLNRVKEKIHKSGGYIIGTNQLIDDLTELAIELHYLKCPYCKR